MATAIRGSTYVLEVVRKMPALLIELSGLQSKPGSCG